MKKKPIAKIYIRAYEDPITKRAGEYWSQGEDTEITAILLKIAVMKCREDLHFSDDEIIDLVKDCLSRSGDQHD